MTGPRARLMASGIYQMSLANEAYGVVSTDNHQKLVRHVHG
jgi:hypothetical protein